MFNDLMLISFLEKINGLYEGIFSPLDNLIEKLPFADWIADALCDSIHLLPFLFIIFFLIEITEYYYADKINEILKKTGKYGVIAGAFAAIFPQCGFSVIASSLYSKRIITRGCLIAVYLATSDETIPILLATPEKAYLIVPIIGIKLFIGILTGYFTDLVMPSKLELNKDTDSEIIEEGCCKHNLKHGHKREIIIHPLMHTLNVFTFIFIITLILNYCLANVELANLISGGKFIQPVWAAIIGLIPNCAISIGLTIMLIKGTITFGALIAGLSSNAGLGLLVLLKNNDFKDSLLIIFMLFLISVISGITINLLM